MGRFILTIIVLSAFSVSCKKDSNEDGDDGGYVAGTPIDSTPGLNYYFLNKTGPSTEPFVNDSKLSNAIDTLQAGYTGSVNSLVYERETEFDEGSPWINLQGQRASSYAAAHAMVKQERGLSTARIMVSAIMLQGYLKYQNDLWYAALEKALNSKIPGSSIGRLTLSSEIKSSLANEGLTSGKIIETLDAAAGHGSKSLEEIAATWQENPFQYKPLSFYSGDETLERIWLADRELLANILVTAENMATFDDWYQNSGSEAQTALENMRAVFAKATNKVDPALFRTNGFGEVINSGRRGSCDTVPCGMIWPPSSPGILERLPGNDRDKYDEESKSQPLIDDIIQYVKDGEVTFEPEDDEGFYVYQRRSLNAFLDWRGNPEGQIIEPSEEIELVWEESFKAGSAKDLETHQKVIDTGGAAETSSSSPVIHVSDHLYIEPLPTIYARFAKQYRFLKNYISSLPGDFKALWSIEGTSAEAFATELETEMLALHLLSSRQLGTELDNDLQADITSIGESELLDKAQDFLSSLHTHPSMSADQRFFAVQGRPGAPKSRGCGDKNGVFWTTIGVEAIPVKIRGGLTYDNDAVDEDGYVGREYDGKYVIFVDHFAEFEVCINEPLTRDEWRELLSSSADTLEAGQTLVNSY